MAKGILVAGAVLLGLLAAERCAVGQGRPLYVEGTVYNKSENKPLALKFLALRSVTGDKLGVVQISDKGEYSLGPVQWPDKSRTVEFAVEGYVVQVPIETVGRPGQSNLASEKLAEQKNIQVCSPGDRHALLEDPLNLDYLLIRYAARIPQAEGVGVQSAGVRRGLGNDGGGAVVEGVRPARARRLMLVSGSPSQDGFRLAGLEGESSGGEGGSESSKVDDAYLRETAREWQIPYAELAAKLNAHVELELFDEKKSTPRQLALSHIFKASYAAGKVREAHYKEAEEQASKAVGEGKEPFFDYVLLAAAKYLLHDYAEAHRATMDALKIQPGDPILTRNLRVLEQLVVVETPCDTLYNGEGSGGVQTNLFTILPVPGRPFTGKISVNLSKALPDGSFSCIGGYEVVARDGNGRVRREVRSYADPRIDKEPELLWSLVFDPRNRTVTRCVSDTGSSLAKSCERFDFDPMTGEPKDWDSSLREFRSEQRTDLGMMQIDGIPVAGTRIARVLAGATALDGAKTTSKDVWHSKEYSMTVFQKQVDPSVGTFTSHLRITATGEPDASYFAIPDGFTMTGMQ
jgi:hypothetical protein